MSRSIDKDSSGRISQDELQAALSKLGIPVDAELAARMIGLIDVDGSADISYNEFRRFAALLPQSQACAQFACWVSTSSPGLSMVLYITDSPSTLPHDAGLCTVS